MNVRLLEPSDVDLLASIDRSEHVEVQYRIESGRLVEAPVAMADIPAWDRDGTGEHSVAGQIAFCASAIADGATLLGAFDDDGELMGLATVHPSFEPGLGWLATLHVSRAHRRRGAASALWRVAVALAREAGARSLYVSATPTGSAVRFYLGRGCRLADPVHPELFAHEPEDIHLAYLLDDRSGAEGEAGLRDDHLRPGPPAAARRRPGHRSPRAAGRGWRWGVPIAVLVVLAIALVATRSLREHRYQIGELSCASNEVDASAIDLQNVPSWMSPEAALRGTLAIHAALGTEIASDGWTLAEDGEHATWTRRSDGHMVARVELPRVDGRWQFAPIEHCIDP